MCWNQGPELAWCLALQSVKWAAVLKNTSLVYLHLHVKVLRLSTVFL